MESKLSNPLSSRYQNNTERGMATRKAAQRLSTRPRLRKTVLLLHILFGIGWIGADIVLFILLYTGLTTDDGAIAAACYRAVAVFVPIAIPVLSLGMLATGLVLGWGTKWGLLRYWWVLVKLVLATVMVVLVFVSLLPGVNELDDANAALTADAVRDSLGSAPDQMMFPPVVSFLMLTTAAVLSVYKPWSRTPWSASRRLVRPAGEPAEPH